MTTNDLITRNAESVIKIFIKEPPNLDPITIYLDGGRITVICYDDCWTHYFGSFNGTLLDFLKGLDTGYLSGKFEQSAYKGKRPTKVESNYIERISSAVIAHLKNILK